MPIYFRNTPVREPFIFDSIGADWVQEATSRPDGHPLYHYLQTVSGCGRITIQGKNYFLNENEGVLIAPSIRHSYAARTPVWLTCFATFTGTVEGSIPRILKNRSIIFIEKEQGARIGEMLRHTTHKYGAPPLNTQELSLDCYQLLLQFVEGLSDKALLEDPLYLRYVAPIVEQIETHYNSPCHRRRTQPYRLCDPPVSFPALPPFSGMLRIRIPHLLPYQPCQGASADISAPRDSGDCRTGRLFRSEPFYRHVQKIHRKDAARFQTLPLGLCRLCHTLSGRRRFNFSRSSWNG